VRSFRRAPPPQQKADPLGTVDWKSKRAFYSMSYRRIAFEFYHETDANAFRTHLGDSQHLPFDRDKIKKRTIYFRRVENRLALFSLRFFLFSLQGPSIIVSSLELPALLSPSLCPLHSAMIPPFAVQ